MFGFISGIHWNEKDTRRSKWVKMPLDFGSISIFLFRLQNIRCTIFHHFAQTMASLRTDWILLGRWGVSGTINNSIQINIYHEKAHRWNKMQIKIKCSIFSLSNFFLSLSLDSSFADNSDEAQHSTASWFFSQRKLLFLLGNTINRNSTPCRFY